MQFHALSLPKSAENNVYLDFIMFSLPCKAGLLVMGLSFRL